jgi:hypothetical protein
VIIGDDDDVVDDDDDSDYGDYATSALSKM